MKRRKLDKYKDEYSETIEDDSISISFKDVCEKNCLLENWKSKEDLKQLNKCLKLISSLTWTNISSYNSLGFKSINRSSLTKTLPSQISKDETIFELRVEYNSPRRIFFYRNKNILHIIWFDLNHSVIPYHKNVNSK